MPPNLNDIRTRLMKMQTSAASPLACPVCFGKLRFSSPEADHLTCFGCERVYPVVDGIPVLIAG